MGEKETMSGEALRESRININDGPNRISTNLREAADGSELATGDSDGDAPESDAGPRQSSGRMENIGSSGQDGVGVQDDSAAPNLGSSGQERKGGFLPGAGQQLDPRDVATGQSSGTIVQPGAGAGPHVRLAEDTPGGDLATAQGLPHVTKIRNN